MSLRKHLLNLHLRAFEKPHLTRMKSPAKLRSSFDFKAKLLFHPPRGTKFEDAELTYSGACTPVHWARAPGVGAGPVLLFFHGGCYVFGSPRSHRAMLARLSQMTGLPACLPDYRLAPEHAFPAAVEDAVSCYQALMGHPGGIVIGGDSAGGGLALALLAEIIRLGLPGPLGTFAFSPLTDLTFSGSSVTANAHADVVLPASRTGEMADMYLGDANPLDPRASPLFAKFKGAPPVWLAVGDTEVLLDDSLRMAAGLKAQGVEVKLIKEQNLPHVWPIFQGLLPESSQTLADLAQWITALSPPTSGS